MPQSASFFSSNFTRYMLKLERMLTKKLKYVTIYWAPVVIWAGVIYYLSAQPGLSIATGPADFWTRKPAHIAEYALLSALIYRALSKTTKIKKLFIYTFIFTLLYAISDEIHQHFVINRTGKITDVLFDTAGTLLGILIYKKVT